MTSDPDVCFRLVVSRNDELVFSVPRWISAPALPPVEQKSPNPVTVEHLHRPVTGPESRAINTIEVCVLVCVFAGITYLSHTVLVVLLP